MLLVIASGHCPAQCKEQITAVPAGDQRQSALTLEQQGSNAEAEAAWRAYLKTHLSSPEPYAHLGLLEARQEHYKEAVPLYRKALTLDPSFPGLRMNLGLALFKAGEMKEAVQTFSPLLKGLPPSSPEAQRLTILLGMAHYALGEFAIATPYLKQAAVRDPENLGLRLSLAHSCLWTKQYQCVMDTYHEILLLNAESAEADMLAGEAMDEMKDHLGAIKQFRAAVQANPKEPDVHFGLGYLLWSQRQYEEAASEFEAEIANSPTHEQALLYLGDAQMQMSHPEAAIPTLERAEHLAPALSLAHLDLGVLYNDAGRRGDALRELKIAEKLSPDDQNIHWRLGRYYQETGNKEEAKAEFDRTRSLLKAANVSLVDRLHGSQTKIKASAEATGTPQTQ
jgi:tetratricopeptide (TPR) repeat protein